MRVWRWRIDTTLLLSLLFSMSADIRKLQERFDTLVRIKLELEEQDALILELMRRMPNTAVPETQRDVLQDLFQQISATEPGLCNSFRNHDDPDALRPQIRSAWARIDQQITSVRRDLDAARSQREPGRLSADASATGELRMNDAQRIRAFISHSHADKELAEAFAELVRTAFSLPAEAIRCTSVPAYALPYGVDSTVHIKRDVMNADVLIGIVTQTSRESAWVLFELGARWGQSKHLVPVLTPAADVSTLPPPLRDSNAVKCSTYEVMKLIEELAPIFGVAPPRTTAYLKQVEAVVRAAEEVDRGAGRMISSEDREQVLRENEKLRKQLELAESEIPSASSAGFKGALTTKIVRGRPLTCGTMQALGDVGLENCSVTGPYVKNEEKKHVVVWNGTDAAVEMVHFSGKKIEVNNAIWLKYDAGSQQWTASRSCSLRNFDSIPFAVMHSTTDGNYAIKQWPPTKDEPIPDGEWTIRITLRSGEGLVCRYECTGTVWHNKPTDWSGMRLISPEHQQNA